MKNHFTRIYKYFSVIALTGLSLAILLYFQRKMCIYKFRAQQVRLQYAMSVLKHIENDKIEELRSIAEMDLFYSLRDINDMGHLIWWIDRRWLVEDLLDDLEKQLSNRKLVYTDRNGLKYWIHKLRDKIGTTRIRDASQQITNGNER